MTSDETGPMRLTDFAAALDRHGPRMARWPGAERGAAERLLADSAEARAMLSAAASVDQAVAGLMQPAHPLPPLAGRAASARTVRAGVVMPSWPRLAAFGGAALAASLVLGFALGTALPPPDDDDGADAVYLAVNDTDLGGLM